MADGFYSSFHTSCLMIGPLDLGGHARVQHTPRLYASPLQHERQTRGGLKLELVLHVPRVCELRRDSVFDAIYVQRLLLLQHARVRCARCDAHVELPLRLRPAIQLEQMPRQAVRRNADTVW